MKTKRNFESVTLIKNSLVILALAALLIGPVGCKSKKPIVVDDTENTEKVDAKLVQAKATLKELLSENCTKSIEEKEKILAEMKALNSDDEELKSLIKQVEDDIAKEKEEIRIAEEKAKEAAKPENKLRRYFDGISKASNDADADKLITEALGMFTSDKSNVLIIIAEEGAIKDYDKPTKIDAYLNYLKTTKTNINDVDEIKWEGDKIKTLILRKMK